jgi:hypothetical protein
MRYATSIIALLFTALGLGQAPSGTQLLDSTINYHDPNGVWPSFRGQLFITMQSPEKGDRVSEITLNLPAEYFKLTATRDGNTVEQVLNKGECLLSFNGSTSISDEDAKTHGISCERTTTMKNYYTYLYGLPMKLKDPGTIIDIKVQTKTFKGKEYLVLKVGYEKKVGGDTWYFYFDPTTYAMQVYQFYHDEAKNDGEYILLDGIEEVSGIKMPKARAWYYNKDDTYLGRDILTRATGL